MKDVFLGLADGCKIPDGYKKYVWLSERCIEGIKYCEENHLAYEVIPKPYKKREDMYHLHLYTFDVKEKIIDWLCPILNEYSRVSYAKESWRYMLFRDIDMIVNVGYDKYVRLCSFINKYGEADYIGINNDSNIFFIDNADLSANIALDWFHHYMAVLMISRLNNKDLNKVGEEYYERKERQIKRRIMSNIKRIIYNTVAESFSLLGGHNVDVVLMDTYLPMRFVFDLMRKRPGYIRNYLYYYKGLRLKEGLGILDNKWRQRRELLPQGFDLFTEAMCEIVKLLLPESAIENYTKIEKESRRVFRRAENANAVFTSTSMFYRNEAFKSYMMRIKDKGKTILCDISHGGEGIVLEDIVIAEMLYSDVFYSWGWDKSDINGCRIIPMSIPKILEDIRGGTKNKEILYVDYCYGKNCYLLQSNELFYDETREEAIRFFRELPACVLKRITVRWYPTNQDFSIRKEVESIFPGIRSDEEPSFYRSILTSELVVLSSFETTWIEALYFDIPFIVYMDPRCEVMNVFLDDCEEMRRVGVLVHSFKDVSDMIKSNTDIMRWWREPDRSSVIQKMRSRYTMKSCVAKNNWRKKIYEYVR